MKCPKCGFESINMFSICPNCRIQIITNSNTFSGSSVPSANALDGQNSSNGVVLSEQNVNQVQSVNLNNNVKQEGEISTIQSSPPLNNSFDNAVGISQVDTQSPEMLKTEEVGGSTVDLPTGVSVKKDMSKTYYAILAVCVVIFLILMGILIFRHFDGLKKNENVNSPTRATTEERTTVLTKNKGVYSSLIAPVNVGEITFGGILDENENKITDADVEIMRKLSDTEIDLIVSRNSQPLNPGFRWDGVEYRVTLNDFDYLGSDAIIPKMKTYLFDAYYKNNFFLVNENYYTIEALNNFEVSPIRNGESALFQVAYQVPIDQNYYICFGENFSSLGCFNNF